MSVFDILKYNIDETFKITDLDNLPEKSMHFLKICLPVYMRNTSNQNIHLFLNGYSETRRREILRYVKSSLEHL